MPCEFDWSHGCDRALAVPCNERFRSRQEKARDGSKSYRTSGRPRKKIGRFSFDSYWKCGSISPKPGPIPADPDFGLCLRFPTV